MKSLIWCVGLQQVTNNIQWFHTYKCWNMSQTATSGLAAVLLSRHHPLHYLIFKSADKHKMWIGYDAHCRNVSQMYHDLLHSGLPLSILSPPLCKKFTFILQTRLVLLTLIFSENVSMYCINSLAAIGKWSYYLLHQKISCFCPPSPVWGIWLTSTADYDHDDFPKPLCGSCCCKGFFFFILSGSDTNLDTAFRHQTSFQHHML